jgi:aminoglycoside phosphotransferase (APT) family kinase protein
VPLAHGEVWPARFVLEPKLSGSRPWRLTSRLGEQCLEFLVELHAAAGPGATARTGDALAFDIELLQQYARPQARPTLARVERELARRLATVPLGWGHGDFWSGNLLAPRRPGLTAVVDWDAADPRALPLLDLLHVTGLASTRLRRLTLGERCVDVLWPLARAGGDARMRSYCASTGTPGDRGTLEALAVAYWLVRVGRELRTFADRPRRPVWMTANLHAPLAALASWPNTGPCPARWRA